MTDAPARLPATTPDRDVDTRPFWTATTESRLALPRCNSCEFVIWYPRAYCPACHSTDVSWFDASGNGTVYSYTISRRGVGAFAKCTPYVLAYVELDEGPRVLTNIVDTELGSVRIGQRVTAVFEPTGEDAALLRFRAVTS